MAREHQVIKPIDVNGGLYGGFGRPNLPLPVGTHAAVISHSRADDPSLKVVAKGKTMHVVPLHC